MTMQSYLASMEEWCPGYVGLCTRVWCDTVGQERGWYKDPDFQKCFESQITWKPRLSFLLYL